MRKSHFYVFFYGFALKTVKKNFAYGFENRRTNKKLNKTGGAYGFDFFYGFGDSVALATWISPADK